MVMTTDIRFGIAGHREDPLDKSDSGTELSNGSASAVRIIDSGPRRIGKNIGLPGSTSIKNKVKIFTINLIFTTTYLVILPRCYEKSPPRSVHIAVDSHRRHSRNPYPRRRDLTQCLLCSALRTERRTRSACIAGEAEHRPQQFQLHRFRVRQGQGAADSRGSSIQGSRRDRVFTRASRNGGSEYFWVSVTSD